MEKLINTIFPPKCVFCGSVGDVFCENCISTCSLLQDQRCVVCDKVSEGGKTHTYHYYSNLSSTYHDYKMEILGDKLMDKVNDHIKRSYPTQFISPFVYEKNVRECIRKSKYSSRLFSCLKRLSFEGVNIVFELGYLFDSFIVVPIPVSREKKKLRGFNQADIISKIFAKRFSLTIDTSVLFRIKDKHAQHDLSRIERFRNIEGSFVSNYTVKGKKFILVDDICTTGATFLEASRTLFDAGAVDVKCFSLSKKL